MAREVCAQRMSKSVVLSNGNLHIGLNEFGEVADVYYPYVGLEQQSTTPRLANKIGIWVDEKLSWLDDGNWRFTYKYHPRAIIADLTAHNEKLQVSLEFTDAVSVNETVFVRNIHVVNTASSERELKVFFHQAFLLSQSVASETCQYMPEDEAIVHYQGRRVCFIGAQQQDDASFHEFTVGLSGQDGHEGTWRDAEDGMLSGHPVELGSVDSTIGVQVHLGEMSSARIYYWMAFGETISEARRLHNHVRDTTVHTILTETAAHWRTWLSPITPVAQRMPQQYIRQFDSSLFVVKAHQDTGGAVMASLDSSVLAFTRDAYAYCWPRDAAYSLWPLLRLGYKEEILSFFAFISRGISDEGYLEHKYMADGALGPTWHGYINENGEPQLPIQTDETAITLFLIGQYFRQYNDHRFLTDNFMSMVEPMASFLAAYIGDDGLPRPSFDIWEQEYQTTTYTTAVTFAALTEAASLADAFGRPDAAKKWMAIAQKMQEKAKIFYNTEKNYFFRGIRYTGAEKTYDSTIDIASLYGAFMFGLFELDSPEIIASFTTAQEVLQSMQVPGGYMRFENDTYYQDGETSNVWIVPSLWMAEMHLERDEKSQASTTLDWVMSLMQTSPMLPEQVNPTTGVSTFVSPLVWSHAELLNTLLDFIQTPEESDEAKT